MSCVALNNFDPEKLVRELVRQLRRHRALDAFLEMVSTDIEHLTGGDETILQEWVEVPPIRLLWGTHGSAPMYSMLRDRVYPVSGWKKAMSAITHTLQTGDSTRLFHFLRSNRSFGPLVEEAAAGNTTTLIAAACMLRTGAGRATASEQGAVVDTNGGLKNSIEVCDAYVRVNGDYYEGLGKLDWSLVAPNTQPVQLPRLLTAIITDALMLDDPMIGALLAAYTLTLTEGVSRIIPSKLDKPSTRPKNLDKLTPEEAFRRITDALVPRMQELAGVYNAMDYFELYPDKGHEMPVQPVNNPGKPEPKVYDTLKMAGSKYIGEYIKGRRDNEEVAVNLLELFNFYVVMYPYQTPTGFRSLTRQPAIVDDRPNVVTVTVSKLKSWHLKFHDTERLMERC